MSKIQEAIPVEIELVEGVDSSIEQLPIVLRGKLFTVQKFMGDNKITAKCSQCEPNDPHALVKGSIGNTFNFWRHYERHHNEYLTNHPRPSSVSTKRKGEDDYMTQCKRMKSSEDRINNSNSTCGKSLQMKQEQFDHKLLKYVIYSLKPFNTVDDPTFREMIGVLDDKVKVMSRRTLGRRLIEIHEEAKAKLTKFFKSVGYLSSTADVWSTKHRSFLGVTVHYIDDKTFVRHSAVIACQRFEGRHTFDRVAKKLQTIYEGFELDNRQIVSTITDNATNFVKAFREFGYTESALNDEALQQKNQISNSEGSQVSESLERALHGDCHTEFFCSEECDLWSELNEPESQENDDNQDDDGANGSTIFHRLSETDDDQCDITLPAHLRCASHTLNLLSTTDFAKYLKNSDLVELHNNIIQKCQNLWSSSKRPLSSEVIKNCLGCTVKYPTVVRWNTFHDSLGDIIKHKSKLNELFNVLGFDFQFTETDFNYIEELHRVMGPISTALDLLQADSCFYGELLPILFSLRTRLISFLHDNSLGFLHELIPHLVESLEKRFGKLFYMNEENSDALAASVLLPHRKFEWIPLSYNDATLELVKEIVIDACEKCINQYDEEFAQSVTDRKEASDRRKNFLILRNPVPKYETIREEFDSFLKDTRTCITMLHSYPRLTKCFIRYNASLCSSAPVERLFSTGGVILGSRRCSLSDESFEMACFLKSNPHLF